MSDPRARIAASGDAGTSAIVLAGGRSTRFGRDKLVEPVDGRPLIERAIDAVRPLAAEVIVVAAPADGDEDPTRDPEDRRSRYPLPADVTLIRDPVAFEGPLVGVLAGLRATHEPIVIVVAGDMPTLVPAVLAAMVERLEAAIAGAVVLEHDGRPRPFPMVLRRARALEAAGRLVDAGERRLRALALALDALTVPETEWRRLDPDARTMRDIDAPGDLH
jgi:molybdopterin-guanine dinucleotide biosynthesis protein A